MCSSDLSNGDFGVVSMELTEQEPGMEFALSPKEKKQKKARIETVDFESMTVGELKQLCREGGLPLSKDRKAYSKEQLIAQLRAQQAQLSSKRREESTEKNPPLKRSKHSNPTEGKVSVSRRSPGQKKKKEVALETLVEVQRQLYSALSSVLSCSDPVQRSQRLVLAHQCVLYAVCHLMESSTCLRDLSQTLRLERQMVVLKVHETATYNLERIKQERVDGYHNPLAWQTQCRIQLVL